TLSRRLLGEQEAERTRIARGLNYGIGQQLAILSMELDVTGSDEQRADSARRLSRALERVHGLSRSVRELSHGLHPTKLQLIGLVAALDELQRDFSQPHLSIAFSDRDVPTGMDHDIALCLFRLVQEILQNAVKHSDAGHVWIELVGGPPGVTLTIIDDGKGFDLDCVGSDGLGLITMRERVESVGGTLNILSTPGSGTRVRIVVPLPAAATSAFARISS